MCYPLTPPSVLCPLWLHYEFTFIFVHLPKVFANVCHNAEIQMIAYLTSDTKLQINEAKCGWRALFLEIVRERKREDRAWHLDEHLAEELWVGTLRKARSSGGPWKQKDFAVTHPPRDHTEEELGQIFPILQWQQDSLPFTGWQQKARQIFIFSEAVQLLGAL